MNTIDHTKELIDSGLIPESMSHYTFEKCIYHKNDGTKSRNLGCLITLGIILVLWLVVTKFTLIGILGSISILVFSYFAYGLYSSLSELSVDHTIDMIYAKTCVQLSEGTVFYKGGSFDLDKRVVFISDKDLPLLKEYILQQEDKKSDTYYCLHEENMENGCGNTQSLTIDLKRKIVLYEFTVY